MINTARNPVTLMVDLNWHKESKLHVCKYLKLDFTWL